MNDRRIEDRVYTFGNEGVLFMSAMTWWDWETGSIWSQPWGAAIDGELTGTRLTLLPYELVPWDTWREKYPDTKVLVDERANLTYRGAYSIDRFVIGVSIGDAATGFYFASTAIEGVVNESVGDFPVAVFADRDTGEINVFLRSPRRGFNSPEVLPDTLTFELVGADGPPGPGELPGTAGRSAGTTPDATGGPQVARVVRDRETGSTWDIGNGVATDGPLRGTLLQRAPYISAYYWAWEDFNPNTTLWGSRFDELDGPAADPVRPGQTGGPG